MAEGTDPDVWDAPPQSDVLTEYDLAHRVTYLRLLDAEAAGADWSKVVRLVLRVDPSADAPRARAIYDSHLARARWMTVVGYKLMKG